MTILMADGLWDGIPGTSVRIVNEWTSRGLSMDRISQVAVTVFNIYYTSCNIEFLKLRLIVQIGKSLQVSTGR